MQAETRSVNADNLVTALGRLSSVVARLETLGTQVGEHNVQMRGLLQETEVTLRDNITRLQQSVGE